MAVISALGALLIVLAKTLIVALAVPVIFVAGHVAWDVFKPIPRRGR